MRQSYSKILISLKKLPLPALNFFPKIILHTHGIKENNTFVMYGLLNAVSLFLQGLEWDSGH